jgi:diadenosine tetraphosphate (Ap4A) HIT family hydrolase
MDFKLDARLQGDCHVLGNLQLSRLLLMNNAAVPWFILVPVTEQLEICDLTAAEQSQLWSEVQAVSEFVRSEFTVDKLNVAAIGNVVSQLHVHVVGRRKDDYCWPDVVWGRPTPKQYYDEAVAAVAAQLINKMEFFVA